MAHTGREFEKLVEKLESLLSGTDVTIIRNARLTDKRTGGDREIDILIKGNFAGTHELTIILECRDRKANPDVRWIDEIKTKRDAVGAHKAVAISSKPLTKEAMRAAEAENISVRNLGDITISEVATWFKANAITVVQPNIKLENTRIKVCGKDEITEHHQVEIQQILQEMLNNGSQPYLYDPSKRSQYSMSKLWNEYVKLPDSLIHDLETKHKGSIANIIFTLDFVDNPMHIIPMKDVYVCEVIFSVAVSITIRDYPPSQIMRYSERQNVLSDIIRFNVEVDGREVTVEITNHLKGFKIESSSPVNMTLIVGNNDGISDR